MPLPDLDSLQEVQPSNSLPDFESLKPISSSAGFKLTPDQIRNESSNLPSQTSSGYGNLFLADNPDFDFTRAVAGNPIGFVKDVPARNR